MVSEIEELKQRVFHQSEKIKELNDKHHAADLTLVGITKTLEMINSSQIQLKDSIKDESNKNEAVTTGVYNRFRSMDSELKGSFKERDDKIVNLQLDSAKLNTRQLVYASVIFTVVTVIAQLLIPVMKK